MKNLGITPKGGGDGRSVPRGAKNERDCLRERETPVYIKDRVSDSAFSVHFVHLLFHFWPFFELFALTAFTLLSVFHRRNVVYFLDTRTMREAKELVSLHGKTKRK